MMNRSSFPAQTGPRSVTRVVTAVRTLEGGGFPVRRPFPSPELMQVDPFLLLDHLGPVSWGPREGIGAPDHPHRGFETVTYILSGELRHRDSRGHTGLLGPGDVQWMTAGAGIVHSELPSEAFMREGGVMHGLQIWVNLPARDKMIRPRYQEVPGEGIPTATSPDGLVHVRVIAGSALGVSAVIATHTPIIYLHYSLQPGGRVDQPLPGELNALVYSIRGRARVGAQACEVVEGQLAVLAKGGGLPLSVDTGAEETAELIVLAGTPLGEPVVRNGPFVMNTREQILQAFDDYKQGRMGVIAVP